MTRFYYCWLIASVILSTTASCLAQSSKYSFEAFDDIELYKYDLLADTAIYTSKQICRAGIKLAKVGTIKNDRNLGGIQVVRIIDIDTTSDVSPALRSSTISSEDSGLLFCFKESDLKEGTLRKRYATTYSWARYLPIAQPAFGTIIVPFKSRRSITRDNQRYASSFSSSSTIGPSLGARFRISRYNPHYLSIIGVYGLANANVDSATTQGFERKSKDLAAITKAVGLVLEFDNVQAGLFIGDDKVSGETGNKWIYNGKRWFAVGLGYQFIKANDEKE
jgi:hypothetical protein